MEKYLLDDLNTKYGSNISREDYKRYIKYSTSTYPFGLKRVGNGPMPELKKMMWMVWC